MRRKIWRQTWQDSMMMEQHSSYLSLSIKKPHMTKWKIFFRWLNWMKMKEIEKHSSKHEPRWSACPFHHQLMWHFFLWKFQPVTHSQFGLIIETFSFPFWLTWLTSSSISNYKELDLFMETAKKYKNTEQHINYFQTLMKQQCCCWNLNGRKAFRVNCD